jgi:hypothetical protein
MKKTCDAESAWAEAHPTQLTPSVYLDEMIETEAVERQVVSKKKAADSGDGGRQ